MRGNIIKIHLSRGRTGQSGTLSQWDKGQRLIITGCDLPERYQVHFSNEELGKSKPMIGDATGVDIPDEYLQSGKDVHVWVYVVDSTHAETEYHGIIKVTPRAEPTDLDPTPVQKTVIDQAMVLLEEAVVKSEENVHHYPYINEDGYWMVYDADAGDFVNTGKISKGDDGDPTTLIDDAASAGTTDKTWSVNKITDKFSQEVMIIPGTGDGSARIKDLSISGLTYHATSSGMGSVALGLNTSATANGAFAEGLYSASSGVSSHSEGAMTKATGQSSHAEGGSTTAAGTRSHAEGFGSVANGQDSHAEGQQTIATAIGSHAQGRFNVEDSQSTYADIVGNGTSSARSNAYALTWTGDGKYAGDVYVHANSDSTGGTKLAKITDIPDVSHFISDIEKGAPNGIAELDSSGKVASSQLPSYVDDVIEYSTLSEFPQEGESGKIYVALDTNTTYRWSGTTYVVVGISLALGETEQTAYRGDRGKAAYDHASAKGSAFNSGLYKITTNNEGHVTNASAVTKSDIMDLGIPGDISTKAEKAGTILETTLSMGRKPSTALGAKSTALGNNVTARGNNSMATGYNTVALGHQSHAEGSNTNANGDNSHSEGSGTRAQGNQSHAEGVDTVATGNQAHTEGSATTASGNNAHSEGLNTIANGYNAHAEGNATRADGTSSHAEGTGTIALSRSQRVGGEYNVPDPTIYTGSERGDYIEIIGNGTNVQQSNAYALDWNGNGHFMGDVYVHTDGDSTGGTKLATINDISNVNKFIVNFVIDTTNNSITCDKTIAEILQAADDGEIVEGDVIQQMSLGALMHSTATYNNASIEMPGMEKVNVPVFVTMGNEQYFISGYSFVAGRDTWEVSKVNHMICLSEDGFFDAMSKRISNMSAPTANTDAANKQYVDTAVNTKYTKPASGIPASDLASGVIPTVPVQDVQVNGTSVLNNGVANVPIASDNPGVVRASTNLGVGLTSAGYLAINGATSGVIKTGTAEIYPLTPGKQHESIFYGLAKAAGDTTQSQSSNAIGTYTTEAKAAIRTMLDVPATGDIPSVSVTDVQVNGSSVLSNGIANVPLAGTDRLGVIKVTGTTGIAVANSGLIYINKAPDDAIKEGTFNTAGTYRPIVPGNQHQAAFYGLAKASGDITQSASANAVGVYTDTAKTAIQNMLGVQPGLEVVRLI